MSERHAEITQLPTREISRAEYELLIIKINATDAKLDLILSKVDMIAQEVKPTLDALMKSPMIKMLTGGK